MIETHELVDNDFLRQFEMKIDNELAKIEYSLQERKIFLTKLVVPEEIIEVDEITYQNDSVYIKLPYFETVIAAKFEGNNF